MTAAVSALVVPLAEAEALAQDLRARHDPSAFDAEFAGVGRCPATAWLAPRPAAPFVAPTMAVWARWPLHPPYSGAFSRSVPHLTVADGDAAAAERVAAELQRRLAAHGPLRVRCREVVLLDNAGGRFRLRHRFHLGRAVERNPGSP